MDSSYLFTKSYYGTSIPDEWKSASFHNKGSKSDVQNYRPISLTCIIMNVMERIVRDELMARCGHLIDPRQHGFTTQLVDFCDSVSLSLNSNIRSDVIDFSKDFDSVNHDLILTKLKSLYSIDSCLLQIISKYLSLRNNVYL